VTVRLREWLAERSARERRMIALAAGATALWTVVQLGAAGARDLGAARERVDARRRELATVHQLARELERSRRLAAAPGAEPLVTRLEAAASSVVGRERIASMTPLAGEADAVALRLVGATLGEAVRLLHEVEAGGGHVEKLDMVKHPDDSGRFDLLLEVAGAGPR